MVPAEEPLQTTPSVPLSWRTTLLFFAAVLLVYLVAGVFLQSAFGLRGIFFNQIAFLLFPSLWISYAKSVSLFEWPLWRRPPWTSWVLTILGMLFLSFAVDRMIELQNKFWPLPDRVQNFYEDLVVIHSWKEALGKSLVLAFTPAFAEEIFFRGVLQPNWVRRFGKKGGIALTALAFAIAHGNPWYFHFYFLLGLFLGFLLEWRGSLWLPITAHLVNNLWTLFSS
ncbi:MAG: type II CAAX endopeptidase family protein [bacterium]